MICLGCGRLGADLCRVCKQGLVEAPDRLLDSGLVVRSCFEHAGPARAIIHAYKYRGSDRAGWLLARAAAGLVSNADLLVPLPRVTWRTIGYGLDPADDFARRLSALTSTPVWRGLRPPFRKPAQAGRSRVEREPPNFTLAGELPRKNVILVDDVITTGRTIATAHLLLMANGGCIVSAVTATAAKD